MLAGENARFPGFFGATFVQKSTANAFLPTASSGASTGAGTIGAELVGVADVIADEEDDEPAGSFTGRALVGVVDFSQANKNGNRRSKRRMRASIAGQSRL